MKISICITVLNEEKNISKLLVSIDSQTNRANEIIIVDAGSTDETINLIKKHKNIKLIISRGASIAKGRNIAIKNAKHEIIVITDAGCILHKNWLAKITKPFKNKSTDVVAGFYNMTGKSDFQKALKPFIGIMPQNFDKNTFLPSARSIAFRKKVWKKIGGFDEKFDRAGEDTEFNLKLLKNKFKIIRVKHAIVDWEVPNNIVSSLKKFFYYSRGDVQGGKLMTSHNIKVLNIFFRYFIFLSLLFLYFLNPIFSLIFIFVFLLYLFSSIVKMLKFVKGWKALCFVPIIQVSSDFAVMAGFLSGTWDILNK